MKTFATLAAAVALTLSVLPSAQAANPNDVSTTLVRFGDLDLNKPAGVATLYDRIQNAAQGVCGRLQPTFVEPFPVRIAMETDYKSCMEQAIHGAVVQINRPSLTGLLASKGHIFQG
jgi:UrcA family protein